MNISSRVDWPVEWKGRQNKKIVWTVSCSWIAANEAVCTQDTESTHQRSFRQRMVSIKRNTTKLLVSLERIFLNYHKHPQNSLQWISRFGASSNYSSVLGQSMPWRAVLWEQWELSPPWAGSLNSDDLGGLTVPEKKGGNSHYPLSSFAILLSCCNWASLLKDPGKQSFSF